MPRYLVFLPVSCRILVFRESMRGLETRFDKSRKDGLVIISSSAWDTFFRELEDIEDEDIPDDFVEQFRMSNFRTSEELAL
jgi:hypothetical protein